MGDAWSSCFPGCGNLTRKVPWWVSQKYLRKQSRDCVSACRFTPGHSWCVSAHAYQILALVDPTGKEWWTPILTEPTLLQMHRGRHHVAVWNSTTLLGGVRARKFLKKTTKTDMLSVNLSSLLASGLLLLGLWVSSILSPSINRRNHYRIKIRLFQKATSFLRPIPAFLNLHLAGFVSRPYHTKHNNKSNLIRIEP